MAESPQRGDRRLALGALRPGRRGPDTGKAAAVPDTAPGYQDVTSTGMSTFGGLGTGGLRTSYGDEVVPRPRRLAAVAAFGALAVAGAAGSYYAVVTGIDALVADRPAGAEPYPLAARAPQDSEGDQSNSGLGRGVVAAPAGPAPATTAPGTVRILPPAGGAAARRLATAPRLRTTVGSVTPATRPTDCCLIPPVPTPTAPVPTPQSPSATASPSASASESAPPSEEPTTTASPTPSGEPDGMDERRSRPRRAHRH
nr:hypothetical protein GCM10020092_086650 [Actinoplanes digitatis]